MAFSQAEKGMSFDTKGNTVESILEHDFSDLLLDLTLSPTL